MDAICSCQLCHQCVIVRSPLLLVPDTHDCTSVDRSESELDNRQNLAPFLPYFFVSFRQSSIPKSSTGTNAMYYSMLVVRDLCISTNTSILDQRQTIMLSQGVRPSERLFYFKKNWTSVCPSWPYPPLSSSSPSPVLRGHRPPSSAALAPGPPPACLVRPPINWIGRSAVTAGPPPFGWRNLPSPP